LIIIHLRYYFWRPVIIKFIEFRIYIYWFCHAGNLNKFKIRGKDYLIFFLNGLKILLSFLDFNKPIETNFPDFDLKVFLKILLHFNAQLAQRTKQSLSFFSYLQLNNFLEG
tara:strand:- start:55 stop:387 length:333 start_codon:yes stop_codon:yes gene_type:complete